MTSTYPRMPHLLAGRGTRDDLLLSVAEIAELVGSYVVVEEKLDGANVSIGWAENGIAVALRGGPDTLDRGGQLGPLRAYLAAREHEWRDWFDDGRVLYAEWLWFTHSIGYDALDSPLVAIDVRCAERWLSTDERNAEVARIGLAVPPELFRGVPGSVAAIEALIGRSRVGDVEMEGVVVRRDDRRHPRLAKLVRHGFERFGDDEFGRRRNSLRAGQPSQ